MRSRHHGFVETGRVYQDITASDNAQVHNGDIYHLPPERPETPPRPLSTVPFLRDPDYVHREHIVSELRRKLSVPGARVALVGLGGVGKSQLAIEYAHRLREDSPETWVLWLHASNAARFELSVRDALEQLKVSGRDDPKANVFRLLRSWLRDGKGRKWMVILDNADDVRFLLEPPSIEQTQSRDATQRACHAERYIDYLPVCSHGSLLFTTRTELAALSMTERNNFVKVKAMTREHAVTLLTMKLEGQHNREELIRLAAELDFMPLAMTQAAAYVNQRGPRCSVLKYIEKLEKNKRFEMSLLERNEGDLRRDREAANSIISTWQISFEHILSIRRSAAEMLSLMSCFDRQAIPETLLRTRGTKLMNGSLNVSAQGGSRKRDVLPAFVRSPRSHKARGAKANHYVDDETDRDDQNVNGRRADLTQDGSADSAAEESEDFEQDIVMLQAYSFISITANASAFEMHRLVQFATQRWLESRGWLERWQSQFISNLNNAFPFGKFENWAKCQLLLPHAILAFDIRVPDRDTLLQQASLLHNSGWYANEQGMYSKASQLQARSTETYERVLGPEDPGTLASKSNLAKTYMFQHQYGKAAELVQQVLEVEKRVLGLGHPSTVGSVIKLALIYARQGRHDEAVNMCEQVFELRKRMLGPEHQDTLGSMHNLAFAYQKRGHYDKSADLGEQVLVMRKKLLGLQHPDTLNTLGNLAVVYRTLGKHDEAAELGGQAFETRKSLLGPEHPNTLSSMTHFARAKRALGQRDLALDLMMRSAAISSKVLGDEHPLTVDRCREAAAWTGGYSVEEYISAKGEASLDEAVRKMVLSWEQTTPGEDGKDSV